jgi:phenylpropionate dioxygenase-like ring-hydroxylating dioxygenase large terminal subunit
MTTLTIDDAILSTLEEGYTLPASWYTDRAIAELERERILSRSWQYAGPAELVAEPGSFLAIRIAHAPVVLVRDEEGELRGFVNVCRHRAHLVASGNGKRKALQCPYHAWTYGLDGCLRSAPRSDREPAFDRSQFSLIPVKVERLGPMLFANLDTGAGPLADVLGEVPARLAEGGVDLDQLVLRRRSGWNTQANWKTGLENYLECYHCPVAHPGLSKVVDVSADAYRLEEHGMVASQYGNPRDPDAFADTTVTQAQYHLLFPATTFNVELGPMNLSVDASLPGSDPGTSLGFADFYAPADVGDEELGELMAFADQVGKEDEALVEGVREGLESGLVPQGRLITSSEHQIAWFQRLVFEALSSRG